MYGNSCHLHMFKVCRILCISTCIIPKGGGSGLLISNIQITDRIILPLCYSSLHRGGSSNLPRLVLQPFNCVMLNVQFGFILDLGQKVLHCRVVIMRRRDVKFSMLCRHVERHVSSDADSLVAILPILDLLPTSLLHLLLSLTSCLWSAGTVRSCEF